MTVKRQVQFLLNRRWQNTWQARFSSWTTLWPFMCMSAVQTSVRLRYQLNAEMYITGPWRTLRLITRQLKRKSVNWICANELVSHAAEKNLYVSDTWHNIIYTVSQTTSHFYFFNSFVKHWPIFTRESSCCFQRVLAIAILSVRLSVRLFVTRLDKSKMVQARNTKSSPSATQKNFSFRNRKAFP